MKYLEVSKRIKLSKPVSAQVLKTTLIERLSKVMDIEKHTDGTADFQITGTTGAPASLARDARISLDVNLRIENDVARILIGGPVKLARSLSILYGVFIVLLVLVGLLPGLIGTGDSNASTVGALLFVIFGIFAVTDIQNKIQQPREYLSAALDSIETEFG